MARPPDARLDAVRRFNRVYTRRIGVLQKGLLGSPFSLAELRVLYELAHRERPVAADLVRELGLDAGYLSRILRGFERRQLLERRPAAQDGRRSDITLTASGRRAVAALEDRSRAEVAELLSGLSAEAQGRLLAAMRAIEELVSGRPQAATLVLRPHRPGDLGWIVHRHGELYAQEWGYDERFEGMVAGIVADFVRRFDPRRERCWMAERDGERVGCIALVQKSRTVGQLRLLLVEPSARGLGVGRKLVEECVRFARQVGYRRMTLYTHNTLDAARHLYREAGFRLVHEEPDDHYGRGVVAETWELDLSRPAVKTPGPGRARPGASRARGPDTRAAGSRTSG
ncbi:MAG TPA: helix-turn-helix domain-containing GNAT family N-acetyltransferase [Vicinamibacteria bacterium]|nr:helix-turn-helix domain-containing GNAT family N-acetyltransferase [Vicinamibacteria bacterium]